MFTPETITFALTLLAGLFAAAGALGMALAMKDGKLAADEFALPNGAATTYSVGHDLGIKASSPNDFAAMCELELTCPDLAVGNLANTETITFHLIHDDALPLDASSSVICALSNVPTGAGGAGASGFTARVRLPLDVKKYVGWKAVKTGATGNASTVDATSRLIF